MPIPPGLAGDLPPLRAVCRNEVAGIRLLLQECGQALLQFRQSHEHAQAASFRFLGEGRRVEVGLSVALVAYNVLALVKAALRSVHGEEKIAHEVSGYYLAGHLGRTYDGMMIAVPEEEWTVFHSMSTATFTKTLHLLANQVNLAKFKKHKRGPKKPKAKPTHDPSQPHVSTAKLLKGERTP